MIVPFDPGSVWGDNPDAPPDVVADDGRRRRSHIAVRYVLFFVALSLL